MKSINNYVLDLSITNGIVSSKMYDRRDDFNFEIVNFLILYGDVPHSPSMVYIFRILYSFCESLFQFLTPYLSKLKQGYQYHKNVKYSLIDTTDTQS